MVKILHQLIITQVFTISLMSVSIIKSTINIVIHGLLVQMVHIIKFINMVTLLILMTEMEVEQTKWMPIPISLKIWMEQLQTLINIQNNHGLEAQTKMIKKSQKVITTMVSL